MMGHTPKELAAGCRDDNNTEAFPATSAASTGLACQLPASGGMRRPQKPERSHGARPEKPPRLPYFAGVYTSSVTWEALQSVFNMVSCPGCGGVLGGAWGCEVHLLRCVRGVVLAGPGAYGAWSPCHSVCSAVVARVFPARACMQCVPCELLPRAPGPGTLHPVMAASPGGSFLGRRSPSRRTPPRLSASWRSPPTTPCPPWHATACAAQQQGMRGAGGWAHHFQAPVPQIWPVPLAVPRPEEAGGCCSFTHL